jgi:hypothetical protein
MPIAGAEIVDFNVTGPFSYRSKGGLLHKGDKIAGHTHGFTHVTIVYTGGVRVKCTLPSGEVQSGEFRVRPPTDGNRRPYFPKIVIYAHNEHEFTALEDDTYMECWYVHRNSDGSVAESFSGNLNEAA